MPPVLFLLEIVLAIQDLLWFQMNLRIFFFFILSLWKISLRFSEGFHWIYRLVQEKLKSLQWVFSSYYQENISSKFSCRFYTRFIKFVLSYFRLFSVLLIDVFCNSHTGNKENYKFNLCGTTLCNSALSISLIFSWLS